MDHVTDSLDPPPSYCKLPASDDARRKFPVIPRRTPEQGSTRAPGIDVAVHASIRMRAGILSLRDAIPSDADAYVKYWHYSGDKIIDLLGIDPKKLGTPEDSGKRFLQIIRVPGANQANVVFTITLNSEVIGYTNINRYGPYDNYVHLHTYRSAVRSALKPRGSTDKRKTGAGVAGVVIGLMMEMYYRLLPVRRLVLQTRPENRWINHALDLYMPPAETIYLDSPAGLAAPNMYHLRYVSRECALWMVSRAKQISALEQPQFSQPHQNAIGARAPSNMSLPDQGGHATEAVTIGR